VTTSTLFDGADDRIESSTGGNPGAFAGFTVLYLHYPETVAGFDTVFSCVDDGAASALTFGLNAGAGYLEINTGNVRTATAPAAPSGGWYAFGWTKPSGTSQVRYHEFDGRNWVHANVGGTSADPVSTIQTLEIGRYDAGASDLFDGDIAAVFVWREDTTDGNFEALLADFANISGKSNRWFGTGQSLLSGGTMTDWSSAANNETARTGATTGVRDLPGWFTGLVSPQNLPAVTRWSQFVGTTGQPTEVLPTGATTGDLVIVHGATDTGTTIGWSTGWSERYNTNHATASTVRWALAARVLDGSGDDTLAVTLGGGTNTNDFAFQGILIPAALHGVSDPATDIEIGSVNQNTTNAPNPPEVTWASGNRLVIALFGADDDDTTQNFAPSNFAGIHQTRSATGTSSCMCASAFREVTGATTFDPGSFAMAASEEWISGTIAIRSPAAATPRRFRRSRAGLFVPHAGRRAR
jgi:hypothetical protein